ncbi:hypothetical protein JXR01_02690 [Candidatus Kaiserbacteria bacterium]|nr:MAG: hypothetical protein JXR01_02690 [Candidatus Kaiserbacteria bacterium]
MFSFFKKVTNSSLPITYSLIAAFILIVLPLQFNVEKLDINLLISHAGFFDLDIEPFFEGTISYILAVFITLTGGLLAMVGTGFDLVLFYTIVDFSETFKIFEPGVNAAWAGFRDVANIIMIAMFVFVAFAVILDIPAYGLKKFGVRILVVAVLINFSLFFTKAIIDVSNITAIQFRKAISVSDTDGNTAGITTIFMQKTGVVDWTYGSAREALNQVQAGEESGVGNAILYTVITMIFFLALTIVMLYGLILMVTRIVMFLVLMLTSSAAFAAYMIPGGNKWWDKWWSHLIQNALFAPVFMIMLWGTVQIIGGINSGSSGNNFSGLVGENSNSWIYIFNMMVVIGLLYASTQVANNLSIGGAKFAGNMSKGGFRKLLSGSLALPLGLAGGAFGLAGRAGRGTVGRAGTALSENEFLRRNAGSRNPLRNIPSRLALNASKKAADTSFDIRDSKSLANSLKSAGVNLGTGVGNYDKMIDAEAKYQNDAKKAGKTTVEDTSKQTPPQTQGPDQTTVQPPQSTNDNAEEAKGTAPVSNIQSTPSNDNTVTNDNSPSKATDTADSRGKQNEIEGAGQDIGKTAQRINEEQARRNPLNNISVNNVGNTSPDQTTVNQPRIPSLASEDGTKPAEEKKKGLLKRMREKTQERIDARANKLAGKTDEEKMLEKILKKTESTEDSISGLKDNKSETKDK